ADELGALGIEKGEGLKAEKKGVEDGADQKHGQGNDHRKGKQVAHDRIAEEREAFPPGGGLRHDRRLGLHRLTSFQAQVAAAAGLPPPSPSKILDLQSMTQLILRMGA